MGIMTLCFRNMRYGMYYLRLVRVMNLHYFVQFWDFTFDPVDTASRLVGRVCVTI